MAAAPLTLGPGGPAWAGLSDEQLGEIATFEQQKDRAEDFARLFKKRYKKKKISEQALQKGEGLYSDAKAAFNGYITQFQFEIRADQQPSQNNLQVAVEKSEKFTSYADAQVYGTSRGSIVEGFVKGLVSTLTETLIEKGIAIWKEYRKANQQEREVLAKKIDQLKWQPFDQIK